MKTMKIIDSHTGGMPTRIIVDGGPDLGTGSLLERRSLFEQSYDCYRTAAIKEPRGVDYLVGGLMCEPVDRSCASGVMFFEGASYLGMCGHGMMGFVATLKHLGRISTGKHRIETPIGVVGATLHENGRVTIENVASFRYLRAVAVDVPSYGEVVGDVVWGGNWFFVVRKMPVDEPLSVSRISKLRQITIAIRNALHDQQITGADGATINQVELFGPAVSSKNDSRNFVLCPGGYYDRSPCGTGTSAKMASLAAEGELKEGQIWRQESIVGSVFDCTFRNGDEPGTIVPVISGRAYVTSEATLVLYPDDPFRFGID